MHAEDNQANAAETEKQSKQTLPKAKKSRNTPGPMAGVFPCVCVRRERKSHQEVLFLWMML